jgi:hypothetical protein
MVGKIKTRKNLEKARRQLAQTKPILQALEKYFGEYPFKRDGYKLIEAPYAGIDIDRIEDAENGAENSRRF